MSRTRFYQRFAEPTGIVNLMEDLGEAMAGDSGMLMLGGGNPAHLPEVQQFFMERLQRIAFNPVELARVVGNYDPPRGDSRFIEAIAGLFREEYGWDIGPENIVLTAGSQAAFFMLFNMFGGECEDGSRRRILLPMVPEYVGYADLGLSADLFTAKRPVIHDTGPGRFKYHVDFDALGIGEDIGAICVSRPTNPTGNVLTDEEMRRLADMARARNIPLIIDNAYGMPFPDILFRQATLARDDNTILCMSLSKLGLPGVRTGIVIAPADICTALSRMNAIINLSMGSFGPALALDIAHTRDILKLSHQVIRPYYERKAIHAQQVVDREFAGLDYRLHEVEGSIFLWLWLPGLPGGCEELYRRLKLQGVLVVPGNHFFPGLDEEWTHRHECLRISYAMHESVVERGLAVIAAEVRKLQGGGG